MIDPVSPDIQVRSTEPVQEIQKQETPPDYRQQRKIIKALLSEDLRIPAETNVKIDQEEQDEVLRRMADGRVGTEQFKKVLLSMEATFEKADGLENIDTLLPVVFSNEKMRAIVAGVSKGVMDSSLELTKADFEALITQFPDPIELEELFNQHADYIPKNSLRDFMKIVYGKRFEYWEQIKLLKEEALRKYGIKEAEKISPVSRYGEIAVQGKRSEMEDAHTVIPEFREKPNEFFAGVYDGHAGRRAADLAAANLHTNLARVLDSGISPKEAIRQAFLETDNQIKQTGMEDGSTVVISYIKDGILYVGNAGDARAVLDSDGKGVRLSHDHKADDPEEVTRIEKTGGYVSFPPETSIPRVNGQIAIARSIGNHGRGLDGFISAEPFTSETKLNAPDENLILACDGVWDVLTDQQAVDLIRNIDDPQQAAELLKDEALKRGSGDNISVVVLKLNQSPKSSGS